MRGGGSKEKGSAFERDMCKAFSLWVSKGERSDLFCRNVGSGGAFTSKFQRTGQQSGHPGDLMASHPLAHRFLEIFLVECKFWKSLQLESALWGKGELHAVVTDTIKVAASVDRRWMLVTKQNNRPTLLFTDSETGLILVSILGIKFVYHTVFNNSVFVCKLEEAFKSDWGRFMMFFKSRFS